MTVRIGNRSRHFAYNTKRIDDFAEQCRQYRKALTQKGSEVVRRKTPDGQTFTLDFTKSRPMFFLAPIRGGYDFYNLLEGSTNRTFFTKEEWHVDHEFIENSAEHFHPAYIRMCPVLRNAPLNPIVLDKDGDHASKTYIGKIVFTQHHDDSVSHYIESRVSIAKDGALSSAIGDCYKLTFPPLPANHTLANGYSIYAPRGVVLEVNGVVSTKVDDLLAVIDILTDQFLYKRGHSLHKAYVAMNRLIEPDINYWLAHGNFSVAGKKPSAALRDWHFELKANPELYALPFSEIELLNFFNDLKFRIRHVPPTNKPLLKKVLAKLKKGDVDSAIDACFYGFAYPSALRDLMVKTGLLTYPYFIYDAINLCVERVGLDKTMFILTSVHNEGEPDLSIIDNPTLLAALAAGFDVDSIKALQKKGNAGVANLLLQEKFLLILDTVYMYERLMGSEVPLELASMDINYAHDYLSSLHTFDSCVHSRGEIAVMKRVDTSDQSTSYDAGKYVIRSPHTAFELVSVGEQMSCFIDAYASRFYYKQSDIVLLTDSAGKYLAFIEILGGFVVRAKLERNERLCSNAEYLEVVFDYMDKEKLKPASLDFGDSRPLYNVYNPTYREIDPDRFNAVSVTRKSRS